MEEQLQFVFEALSGHPNSLEAALELCHSESASGPSGGGLQKWALSGASFELGPLLRSAPQPYAEYLQNSMRCLECCCLSNQQLVTLEATRSLEANSPANENLENRWFLRFS